MLIPLATDHGADQVRVPTSGLDMVSFPPVPSGSNPPLEHDLNFVLSWGASVPGGEPSGIDATRPGSAQPNGFVAHLPSTLLEVLNELFVWLSTQFPHRSGPLRPLKSR
jgi:hypothetical protein